MNSRFYCYGPQGETRNLTDENQAVTSTYFYEAYGKPKGTVPTEQNPYRYGGKFGYYTDNEIQTLQVGARWYSPYLIRCMSRDPIHYRGGDNLSAYVMGNPVKYVDPSGLNVTLTYSQSSGNFTAIADDGSTKSGTGYSGHGSGLNNPNMQNVENVGPIPRGNWDQVGECDNSITAITPNMIVLAPQSGNTCSLPRDCSSFRVHGDNFSQNYTASKGCIIIGPTVRSWLCSKGPVHVIVNE